MSELALKQPASTIPANMANGTTLAVVPLPPENLYRSADLSGLPFNTTAELEPLDGPVGQERALGAIQPWYTDRQAWVQSVRHWSP